MIESAVARAIDRQPQVLHDAAARRPKAWGALAAAGVLAYKEITGRAPTSTEWSGFCVTIPRER